MSEITSTLHREATRLYTRYANAKALGRADAVAASHSDLVEFVEARGLAGSQYDPR